MPDSQIPDLNYENILMHTLHILEEESHSPLTAYPFNGTADRNWSINFLSSGNETVLSSK
jgi:hypothetical protein